MRSVLPIGAGIVGTFGWAIYPILVLLAFVALAKFLGFSYKRSIKALGLMGLFVFSLLFVIHCIRTFSALDAVTGAARLKDYLLLSYSTITVLGLVGSVVCGIISLLLGAFGTIVVFVILATLAIGLFVDFELYGKYEEKHIRKLKTQKLRQKVSTSTDDAANGSPRYSFSEQSGVSYDDADVVAETSTEIDETKTQTTYKESEIAGEVQASPTDYQTKETFTQTYGETYQPIQGNNLVGSGFETQYQDANIDSKISSINFYGVNGSNEKYSFSNNENVDQSSSNFYSNPFGRDAYSETPAFSNDIYQEDYPNVFSSSMDETRRQFMEDTFGGAKSRNQQNNENTNFETNTNSNYFSDTNSNETFDLGQGLAQNVSSSTSDEFNLNQTSFESSEQSKPNNINLNVSNETFADNGWSNNDDPFNLDDEDLELEKFSTNSDFNINSTQDDFGVSGIKNSDGGLEILSADETTNSNQNSQDGFNNITSSFPGMIGNSIDDISGVSKVAGFGFQGYDDSSKLNIVDLGAKTADTHASDILDASEDEEPLVFGSFNSTESSSDGLNANERRDYSFLTKKDDEITSEIEDDINNNFASKSNPQYSVSSEQDKGIKTAFNPEKVAEESNNGTILGFGSKDMGSQKFGLKTTISSKPEFKKPSGFNLGMTGIRYNPPPLSLLKPTPPDTGDYSAEQERKSAGLEEALRAFNIPAKVVNIIRGPKITRYELSVPLGVPVKKIPMYELDIKRALAAKTINIQAPIAGSSYVGIELENDTFTTVSQRELLESEAYQNFKDPLPIAVGKDISGEIVVKSLAKMVHLLIAGSTGSGKSVFIHSIVMSLIYRHSPEELRLIMIDPKKVEFNRYNGLPHLLTPEIVMGTDKAVNALKWCVKEMERRYDLLSKSGYNNIEPYNRSELVKAGQFERFPYIVIIVDEIAELMMVNKKEVEAYIQRITQLARACGMHMILATQRPSVDIISGVIKNNVPSRIAFSLSSGIDSKTILNTVGAEKLLGQGDMLFSPNGTSSMPRLQAAYCTDDEIKAVIEYDKQNNAANYDDAVSCSINAEPVANADANGQINDAPPPKELDQYFKIAVKYVMQNGSASTSYLQRRLSIGYSRAAKIMDQMEDRNYIAPANGQKFRKVLITPDQFKEDFGEDFDSADI